MERENNLVSKIKERFRILEKTRNIYSYPYSDGTNVRAVYSEESSSHKGAYRGAVDFVVDLGTPILCPLEGVVEKVIDNHDRFGPSDKYIDDLNYITVLHTNGERSQSAHLAKGSALVREGDHVIAGQQLGITGNSGWMYEPHLHFIVFKLTDKPPGFVGLKIRFNS